MRQWNVNPQLLCRKHLLGEHVEHHMFVGSIKKGFSVEGYLRGGFLEPRTLHPRHTELAREMKRLGYNHQSPLPEIDTSHLRGGNINIKGNIEDLRSRCVECSQRISRYETR